MASFSKYLDKRILWQNHGRDRKEKNVSLDTFKIFLDRREYSTITLIFPNVSLCAGLAIGCGRQFRGIFMHNETKSEEIKRNRIPDLNKDFYSDE